MYPQLLTKKEAFLCLISSLLSCLQQNYIQYILPCMTSYHGPLALCINQKRARRESHTRGNPTLSMEMESEWKEYLSGLHKDSDVWLSPDVMLVLKRSKLWQKGHRRIIEALAQRRPSWSNVNIVVQYKDTYDNEETRSGSSQYLHWRNTVSIVFIEAKKRRLRGGDTHLRLDAWLNIENSLLSFPFPPQKIYHMKMICIVSFFWGLDMILPHSNTLNRET